MQTIAIVIPVYKTKPSENEIKSFKQCLNILNKYPIVIVCAEGFDNSFYIKFAKQFNKKLIVQRFKNDYFKNIRGYNKLLLSQEFYYKFKDFKYILIYQLDAWIIQDKLPLWIKKEYDNVGAPWINIKTKKIKKYSGNGGFCLRNVHKSLEVLNYSRKLFSPYLIWLIFKDLPLKYIWKYKFLLKIAFPIFPKTSDFIMFFSNTMNEDKFWAKFAHYINKEYNVCKGKDAVSFAFDTHPDYFFKINNNKLPIGIHGWDRETRISFWKTKIDI